MEVRGYFRNVGLAAMLVSAPNGLAVGAAALLASAALPLWGAVAQEAVRPAVGKPLQSAAAFAKARNYAKALAAVHQAEAVPGRTAGENSVIAQMKAYIASQSGDVTATTQLLNSGSVSPAEALKLIQGEVSIAFKTKNYPQVVYWSERYLKTSPGDSAMRGYQIQGYYLQGKYAEAEKLQAAQIAQETRGGKAPVEAQLQLLYSCQSKLNDNAGKLVTIKQLVTYYPKPDYWLNVIDSVRSKPGFSSRLLLDVYRLEFSLKLVNKPDDAMDMAEMAVQAKLPAEAKDVVDKSFAGGLLGTGPEAARHQRLRALVEKNYADGQKELGKEDAAAASDHDGNAIFALGETYVSFGQYSKGLSMMEEGIKKDDLHHPDDAKLHLGLAYAKAGQQAKAVAALKTVRGTDGTADLAQLWLLRFRHP
jgi:tetratricopeptide (TPR) repeat protein